MEKRRPIFKLTWLIMTALFLFHIVPLSAAAEVDQTVTIDHVSVTIDGNPSTLDESVLVLDERLFLPVAALARLFNASVEWNDENDAVTIKRTDAEQIVMRDGVPVVYFNEKRYAMDTAPYLADGRIYIPLRHAAALMGTTVVWHADERLVELISAESVGVAMAPVFTEAEPYTEEELLLLAKLVQVEAGYESYEGQLAIANIILNRVEDSRFPGTIRDVIYSGKQFPPAHNGLLDKSEPNASVLRAVRDALDGKNNIEDAVYFFNPKVSKGSFWDSLDVVAKIDNHHFAK